MIVWSTPRGTLALPGLTSIRYGAAASTLREMTNSADSPCLRKRGPSVKSATAASAITANVVACRRSGWRSTFRPQSIASHLATADWTSRPHEHLRVRRVVGFGKPARLERADDLGLQRRLVFLEVQRHLFVGDVPEKRPHQEPADEAGERKGHQNPERDDRARTEPPGLQAPGRQHEGRGAKTEHADGTPEHQLVAPASPDLMNGSRPGP